jgi:signal transduction histidine kinase
MNDSDEPVSSASLAPVDGACQAAHSDVAPYEERIRRIAKGTAPTLTRFDELESALAARDEFIAVLGHELRNAIAPLVLLGEQLDFGPTEERRSHPKPQLLRKHLLKLTAIIERIADVSSLRQGKLALDMERVDLAAVARNVIQQLEGEARAGAVEFRLDIEPDVFALCDRMRAKQVIAALATNAIRYAGAGPVDVVVRNVGEDAVLIVQDHGHGISQEQRAHIFDRFDHRGARRAGGFGVGLWVVKTLCHAMGGTATLDSAVGPGARFRVTLARA